MSEFSESYHLKFSSPEDAANLLRRSGLKGYAFPPGNGWITFVVEDGSFEPDPLILDANEDILLHFVSAEDHCWSFAIFDGPTQICAYRCDWGDGVEFDDSSYSSEALLPLIAPGGITTLADLEVAFRLTSFDEILDVQPSQIFARAVGLEHYEWVAFDYVARDYEETPEQQRDIKKIP